MKNTEHIAILTFLLRMARTNKTNQCQADFLKLRRFTSTYNVNQPQLLASVIVAGRWTFASDLPHPPELHATTEMLCTVVALRGNT
jgi:hypothetical protein